MVLNAMITRLASFRIVFPRFFECKSRRDLSSILRLERIAAVYLYHKLKFLLVSESGTLETLFGTNHMRFYLCLLF